MKRKERLLTAALVTLTFTGLMYCKRRDYNQASVEQFQLFNMFGSQFGLKPKEIVLTLDDGPGTRTAELAAWLRKENVPATFFMIGNNARNRQDTLKTIAELNEQGPPLFIIANHSMNHGLAMPDTDVVAEVSQADRHLAKYTERMKTPFFFRAPYGDFFRGGSSDTNRVSRLNSRSDLSKYIGPIFWDVGGTLTNRYSADWACWGSVSLERCLDGYIKETEDKCTTKGCVVLMHDERNATVDMISGANGTGLNPKGLSYVKEMRARGFKIVSLNQYPEAVAKFGRVPDQDFGVVTLNPSELGEQKVKFEVTAAGANKLELWVDGLNSPLITNSQYNGGKFDTEYTFSSTGSRYIIVRGYKNDKLIAQRGFPFVVTKKPAAPAPAPEPAGAPSPEPLATAESAPEVALENLTQCPALKRLLSEKKAKIVHGEYNQFIGKLTLKKTPRRLGGSSWAIDFNQTYMSSALDKSLLTLTFDEVTGNIVSGSRHSWALHPEVTLLVQDTKVDCNANEWSGEFAYPDGKKERWKISF